VPRARLALLLALAALCALPATAGAVLSGVNGRIMFASGREVSDATAGLYMRTIVGSQGGGQVFSAVAPVGGEQHRHPSWSPDRTKVVFARGPSNDYNIHIADLTTVSDTGITSTSDSVLSDRPAWSPDGKKIAWEDEVTNNSNQLDIVVYDVASGTTTNLTNTPTVIEGKPAWSPDSQTIYYAKGDPATNGQDIVKRPAAGGTETLAVDDSNLNEFQPSISPDGTKICYTLQNGNNSASAEVLVGDLTNPPTGGLIITTDNNASADYNCTWSPDSRFIAYVRGAFGAGDLVMEHSDNTDLAPIPLETTSGRFDGNPDWAPDGPPRCSDSKVQVIQGRTTKIRLPCHDTGPAYERTEILESIANDSSPAHGKLGQVKQGSPSTVPYTANAKYTGPDQFEFAGLGINGGSDRGLASILVLRKGACANMKTGNERANKLNGTIAGDRILGLGGKDLLKGFAGRDCLFGGGENDRLIGGGNADRLDGGNGKDHLKGGDGGDTLNGGKAKDGYDGGKGDDKINAVDGQTEQVRCGPGKNDRAVVDHQDTLHGCEHVTRK
jgi:Tol biopolymer transport system component